MEEKVSTSRNVAGRFYEFGPYRLDPDKRLLRRGEEVLSLTPKAFDTLLMLVEKGGQLVEKDELMSRLWPNTFVEENSLTRNISVLRKALGESPNDHHYIVTIPGRGYRFVAPITCGTAGDFNPDEEPSTSRRKKLTTHAVSGRPV